MSTVTSWSCSYKRTRGPRRLMVPVLAGFALAIGLTGVSHPASAHAASTECSIVDSKVVEGTCVGWEIKKTPTGITATSPGGDTVISQQVSGGGGKSTSAALSDFLASLL